MPPRKEAPLEIDPLQLEHHLTPLNLAEAAHAAFLLAAASPDLLPDDRYAAVAAALNKQHQRSSQRSLTGKNIKSVLQRVAVSFAQYGGSVGLLALAVAGLQRAGAQLQPSLALFAAAPAAQQCQHCGSRHPDS